MVFVFITSKASYLLPPQTPLKCSAFCYLQIGLLQLSPQQSPCILLHSSSSSLLYSLQQLPVAVCSKFKNTEACCQSQTGSHLHVSSALRNTFPSRYEHASTHHLSSLSISSLLCSLALAPLYQGSNVSDHGLSVQENAFLLCRRKVQQRKTESCGLMSAKVAICQSKGFVEKH